MTNGPKERDGLPDDLDTCLTPARDGPIAHAGPGKNGDWSEF